MRKCLLLMVSLLAFLIVNPTAVRAMHVNSEENTSLYGTITVEESDSWETADDGSKYTTQIYYVTKTSSSNYVYIELLETNNVKISKQVVGSNFEIVSQKETEDGVAYLLKAKSNISAKTELITVVADIVDPSKKECRVDYSPLGLSCAVFENNYFDKDGNEVSEEEQKASCEGVPVEDPTPPDDPNDVPAPDTGSVIPYIAVGGGLVAIAGVYLYSRKTNKVYKI